MGRDLKVIGIADKIKNKYEIGIYYDNVDIGGYNDYALFESKDDALLFIELIDTIQKNCPDTYSELADMIEEDPATWRKFEELDPLVYAHTYHDDGYLYDIGIRQDNIYYYDKNGTKFKCSIIEKEP